MVREHTRGYFSPPGFLQHASRGTHNENCGFGNIASRRLHRRIPRRIRYALTSVERPSLEIRPRRLCYLKCCAVVFYNGALLSSIPGTAGVYFDGKLSFRSAVASPTNLFGALEFCFIQSWRYRSTRIMPLNICAVVASKPLALEPPHSVPLSPTPPKAK